MIDHGRNRFDGISFHPLVQISYRIPAGFFGTLRDDCP
jgi:hypothetical protein